jgi:hypothetical protein
MHSLPSIESVEPIIDQGFQLSSTFMFLGLKVIQHDLEGGSHCGLSRPCVRRENLTLRERMEKMRS